MLSVGEEATQGKIRRIDCEAVLNTLLAKMDSVSRVRDIDEDAIDTTDTLPGKRNRAIVGAVENAEDLLGNPGARCRVGDLTRPL